MSAESTRNSLKYQFKTFLHGYPLVYGALSTLNYFAIRLPRTIAQEVVFVIKSFRVVRSLDIVIISGGGQLLDSWGGPWAFPYTILKWVLLAKAAHRKCYFLNVGAGPLSHRLSRWFVRLALCRAEYVSFRDANSRSLTYNIGFRGSSQAVADCVYSYELPPRPFAPRSPQVGCVVGLSPMAFRDPQVYWEKNLGDYQSLTQKLIQFGTWLNMHDYVVKLFSTDISFDAATLTTIASNLCDHTAPSRVDLVPVTDISSLFETLTEIQYLITCRFHGVIFAHLFNIPVIALSHHPKISVLMQDIGLSEYNLDISTFTVDHLIEVFIRLQRNSHYIRQNMRQTAQRFNSRLVAQFDTLFPPPIQRLPTSRQVHDFASNPCYF